jgi:hypothetical protein
MGRSADSVVNRRFETSTWLRQALVALAIAVFVFALMLCRIELDGGRFFEYTHEYRKLSETPYAPSGLQSRSLMPFLAGLVGLGGSGYGYFSLVIVILFLAALAFYLIRSTGCQATALMGVILLGTIPVTEFNLYALGWPDQFCGLMFLLGLIVPAFAVVFSVIGIFAHEYYLVLLLGSLAVTSSPMIRRVSHLLLPLLVVLGSKMLFDFPPGGDGVPASIRGFLEAPLSQIRGQPMFSGFLSAMKVFVFLVPCAGWVLWRSDKTAVWKIVVPFCLAGSCTLIAHDTTRIWGLALPALVFTVQSLSRNHWVLAIGCIVNILFPSYSFSTAWSVHLERVASWGELIYSAVSQVVFF